MPGRSCNATPGVAGSANRPGRTYAPLLCHTAAVPGFLKGAAPVAYSIPPKVLYRSNDRIATGSKRSAAFRWGTLIGTLQSTQSYSRAAHRQLAHRHAVPMGQFVAAVQVVLVGDEDGVGEWCRLPRASALSGQSLAEVGLACPASPSSRTHGY